MKKALHCCLAHPCWSGISGVIALVTLISGLKWSENSKAAALVPVETPSNKPEPSVIFPTTPEISLSGKWRIENELTNSTYKAFEGLKLTYDVVVIQTGNTIFVSGEKDSEQKVKGARVIYEGKARTKFQGEGKFENRKNEAIIHLKVTEGSTTREEIVSQCNLKLVDQDLMEGTFSSEAANAIGKCKWRRIKIERQ